MSGVTNKIEEAVKALEKGQLKKALWLTDTVKTERHHQIVSDAARKCLNDKEQCSIYLKDAAVKLQETITAPLDDTDLEGVEEMLDERTDERDRQLDQAEEVAAEKSDEELYENCPDCHVAIAAAEFVKIAERDECDGVKVMEKLQPCLDNQETAPETWLKTMIEVTEQATCNKSEYGQALGELTEYLQRKDSEILKNLDKSSESVS